MVREIQLEFSLSGCSALSLMASHAFNKKQISLDVLVSIADINIEDLRFSYTI